MTDVDKNVFTNACDYHIPAPTGLSTYANSLQARYIASCKACNTECGLQQFDRASRAECLMSCDPSPMVPGAEWPAEGGTINYPDPITHLAEDVRTTYLPDLTALTCPEGVEDNDGKFAGSIKCRPFTAQLQKDVLAAATANAQNACDATRNQTGFRCDMNDCKDYELDACNEERLCNWVPEYKKNNDGTFKLKPNSCSSPEFTTKSTCEAADFVWNISTERIPVNKCVNANGDPLAFSDKNCTHANGGYRIPDGVCAWDTHATSGALHACMGNATNECKAGNSVFDGFNGLACKFYGKATQADVDAAGQPKCTGGSGGTCSDTTLKSDLACTNAKETWTTHADTCTGYEENTERKPLSVHVNSVRSKCNKNDACTYTPPVEIKKDQLIPFDGHYQVEKGSFLCVKLGNGEKARTETPKPPKGSWVVPSGEAADQKKPDTKLNRAPVMLCDPMNPDPNTNGC